MGDNNLYDFLDENVFLVKKEHGNDHWLSELPTTVQVLIEQKKTCKYFPLDSICNR